MKVFQVKTLYRVALLETDPLPLQECKLSVTVVLSATNPALLASMGQDGSVDSALWAGSVIESRCPFVCVSVTKVVIVDNGLWS